MAAAGRIYRDIYPAGLASSGRGRDYIPSPLRMRMRKQRAEGSQKELRRVVAIR